MQTTSAHTIAAGMLFLIGQCHFAADHPEVGLKAVRDYYAKAPRKRQG